MDKNDNEFTKEDYISMAKNNLLYRNDDLEKELEILLLNKEHAISSKAKELKSLRKIKTPKNI